MMKKIKMNLKIFMRKNYYIVVDDIIVLDDMVFAYNNNNTNNETDKISDVEAQNNYLDYNPKDLVSTREL